MKILEVIKNKRVKKTQKELDEEIANCKNETQKLFLDKYKNVLIKEPMYIVELSTKELQLISFYLELENRKPIVNVELDTKIKKEKENE